MDEYFTDEKIELFVTKYNWELVRSEFGLYKLRQKDKHYLTTIAFKASDKSVKKWLVDTPGKCHLCGELEAQDNDGCRDPNCPIVK